MSAMLLVQEQDFKGDAQTLRELPPETIFSYCSFSDLEVTRPSTEGVIFFCNYTRVFWYWELFNTTLISHATFEDCIFQGCSFRGVDFVHCVFRRCRFEHDNLGGACLFDDCRLVECAFEACAFVSRRNEQPPASLFTNCRFFNCSQSSGEGERPPFD